MILRNMIFQLEVIKQRFPAGLVSHHEQASKLIVNSSIEYSGLLITRTLHPDKHQLRDFFNRHNCYRELTPEILNPARCDGADLETLDHCESGRSGDGL
jgi:hypothetical protein